MKHRNLSKCSCWACGLPLYRWEPLIHARCILALWMGLSFEQADGSLWGPGEYRALLRGEKP